MDVLRAVAVRLPCPQCGQRYEVTLAQILAAQEALRHECLARGEVECEPLFHAPLLAHDLIEEFREVWGRLDAAARAQGSELRIEAVPERS